MPPTSTRRRKGGQPGNTNRLRHGLYSKRLLSPAAESPSYESQLTLYRRRLAQLLARQEHASITDYLSYERGIIHYVSLILDLKRAGLTGSALAAADLAAGDGHPSRDLLDRIGLPERDGTGSSGTARYPIRTSPRLPQIPADLLLESTLRTSNCSSAFGASAARTRSDHEPNE